MVSVNPSPAHCYTSSFDLMNMSLPGFNSIPHTAAPVTEGFGVNTIATMPVNVRNNTMSFFEDPTKKIRKPYTIKKSRENWTEQEHDKFLEALHLFDRDWKKIEAFIGSKTVIQIRSHAQKYFLKVQKSGTNEHLPPPRPKRKATHPYPQKASKNVAFTSPAISSLPSPNVLLESEFLYTTDSHSLPANPAVSTSRLPHHPVNIQKSLIKEESENCCSTSGTRDNKQRTRTVTEPNDQESSENPQRVMPNFAEVYSFIGSVFDPNTTGHVQRLKQMDPINLETVLLLMRNLSVNLTSPEFEEQRRLIATYNSSK